MPRVSERHRRGKKGTAKARGNLPQARQRGSQYLGRVPLDVGKAGVGVHGSGRVAPFFQTLDVGPQCCHPFLIYQAGQVGQFPGYLTSIAFQRGQPHTHQPAIGVFGEECLVSGQLDPRLAESAL
jgi:hypothetical protein